MFACGVLMYRASTAVGNGMKVMVSRRKPFAYRKAFDDPASRFKTLWWPAQATRIAPKLRRYATNDGQAAFSAGHRAPGTDPSSTCGTLNSRTSSVHAMA